MQHLRGTDKHLLGSNKMYVHQGRSQEFQKGVSVNGRISIKQRSIRVQLQMLTNCTHVNLI